MAKLSGVKTIDMVNGEITKVSYEGAEYALVKGFGKIGDLALCKRVHPFFTNGAFYEVTEISDEGAWVHAIDDQNDRYHLDVEKSSQVFRKISAQTTPTLEDRVDKLEADVKAIKDKKYVPQEGDIVVVIANNALHANKIGDIGKVGEEKPLSDGGVCVYVPNGPTSAIRTLPKDIRKATPAEVAAYEQAVKDAEKKAEQAKESAKWVKIGRKPGEYKVGDIVRITNDTHEHKVGDVRIIKSLDESYFDVRFVAEGRLGSGLADFKNFELITPVDARFDK